MRRLSLCMIVKNEETMLADCLKSAQHVVDEIIIVDTGSTDKTVEIAQNMGAKVFHFEWCEDFAAARNESLKYANGDYILILDADERLAPEAKSVLRAEIEKGHFELGMLPLYNATEVDAPVSEVLNSNKLAGAPMLVPRLMKNTDDLRFEGIVHEGVEAWISKPGRTIAAIECRIAHLGYAEELVQQRQKKDRNIRLLRRRCELEPANSVPATYLASELLKIRDLEEAEKVADHAWELYRPYAFKEGTKPTFNNLASVRGCIKLNLGKIEEALQVFDEAKTWGADHPNVDLLHGLALEKRGHALKRPNERKAMLIDSLRAYNRCLQRHGIVYAEESLHGGTSWIAWTRAGNVLTLLGEYDDAKTAFKKAIQFNSGYSNAHFGMAEVTIRAGDPSKGLQLLSDLLNDESPDAWIIASMACERMGLIDNLPTFMAKARIQAQEDLFTTPHLRDELIRLHYATHIYCKNPQAGPSTIGILGGLLAQKPFEFELDEGERVDEEAIRLVVQNLAYLERFTEIEALFTEEAERRLPGCHAVIANALRAIGFEVDMSQDRDPEAVPAK